MAYMAEGSLVRMAVPSFCPRLATAGVAASTALVRTAGIGRLRRTHTTLSAPTTSTSTRATPTGSTTATTVEVCALLPEISASFPNVKAVQTKNTKQRHSCGMGWRWGTGSSLREAPLHAHAT